MARASERLERDADRRLARAQRKEQRRVSTVASSTFTRIQEFLTADHSRWREPEFNAVIGISERSLQPLGKHRGKQWYVVPSNLTWGELQEDRLLDEEDPAVPATGPLLTVVVDGIRKLQTYRFHAPGTYAALTAPASARVRSKQPMRPRDALVGVAALNQKLRDSQSRIRGAEAIVAQLRSRDVELRLSADRTAVLTLGPDGRVIDDLVVMVQAAAPLLLPFLRDGKAPSCAVTAHAKPVPAVTVAAGAPPTPWCGACA